MLWIAVLAFGTLFLSHTAPFPFLLDKFAPSRSIWRMPHAGGPPTVYLTFDDGPNPTATPQLLDVLRETGATATFFLIDAHITSETAPIVRRMFEEGHAVALHSDTRALMVKSPDALAAILLRQADRIEQLAGSRPCRLFRPHAGWRSATMSKASNGLITSWWGGRSGCGTSTGIAVATHSPSRSGWPVASPPATSSSCTTGITWTRGRTGSTPWRRRGGW